MSKREKNDFPEHDNFATGLTTATHAAFGDSPDDPKALARQLKARANETRERLAKSVDDATLDARPGKDK
tara:strand:- start:85508 stop:85717 length:210 start_codon:yes stop_codon:yes gene_type:complete